MSPPIISACICTHNGATRLGDSLWSLVCQSAPAAQFQILVIDNASSDFIETRALVQGLVAQGHDIDLVQEPQLGLAHAKNRAAREARGDYIYFLDDDAIANPRLIESYLKVILEHKPDVMGGHVHPQFECLPPPEMDYSQWFMWSLRHFGAGDRWLEEGEYFLGGNLCVSRGILERYPHDADLGRKGDELRGGEEWHLGASEFRRRLVGGAFIFHRVPRERTRMDYVQRVMCGPVERSSCSNPNGARRQRGGYLVNAWAREIALSFDRIAFQFRLALASRKTTQTRRDSSLD